MSLWSKIVSNIKGDSLGPEEKVNYIVRKYAEAKAQGDDVRRRVVKELRESSSSASIHYSVLCQNSSDTAGVDRESDEDLTNIVAVSSHVLALLGEDPGSPYLRSADENEAIAQSCAIQRKSLQADLLDHGALTVLLFESLGAKAFWQTKGDKREQFYPITSMEISAKEQWWKERKKKSS